MQLSNDTLKLVTVRPSRPFRIGHALFTSVANKIPLSVATINYCLQEKAFVTEHIAGGKDVPLDFTNYNTDNGPSALPKGATEYVRESKKSDHEIEMVGINRERTIINKVDDKPQQPIIHIDLEEEKRKEAARKAAEEKAKKEEEARKAEAAAQAAREEQKRLDEIERQKAIDAIIAREQAKAEAAKQAEEKKVVSNDTPAQIEEALKNEEAAYGGNNFAIPVEAKVDVEAEIEVDEEPKSDFTISGRQDSKKTKYDHKRK